MAISNFLRNIPMKYCVSMNEYYTVAKTQYFMPLTQRLFLQENTFLSVKAAFL